MVTFQVERWAEVLTELAQHADSQWREMSTDRDLFHIDMDWVRYAEWDRSGVLMVVTARDGSTLIGWHISLVGHHPHYKGVLMGMQDTYYLLPKYRRDPTLGIRLFLEMEKAAAERGARKLIGNTKSYLDKSPLFERLGWRKEGIIFTKTFK